MDKIIVNNPRIVKRCLNIYTSFGEDLLKNEKAKGFIDEYKDLLDSNMTEDFKRLMAETGIVTAHFYITRTDKWTNDGDYNSFYFNMMGSALSNPTFKKNTFNHDIAVVTYVDKIERKDDAIIIDGKMIYDLENDTFSIKKGNELRYNFSCCDDYRTIEEQANYIKEQYGYNLGSAEIKQINIDVFENILVLDKDGNLYRNDVLYDTEVEYLFRFDSYNSVIIYKDNSTRFYTGEFSLFLPQRRYKKILYEEGIFLAELTDDDILILNTIDYIPDTFIGEEFIGVDDINYINNPENPRLEVIKNKGKIEMPLYPNRVITDLTIDDDSIGKWDYIQM